MPGKGSLSAVAAVAVAIGILALAPAASAFIYWADTQNNRIGRAGNDGTGVDGNFIATGQLPFAIALDSTHIYWTNQNSGSIGRANIDGTGVDNSFITGITKPDGIAVTGSSIYWATIGGPIGRADISGANKNLKFITGPIEPCVLAVDSGHVYWADIASGPAYIGRAGLDGFSKQLTYVEIPGVSFPCGVAVNSANIFWGDQGFFGGGTRIGRATISGSGADPSFIGDASTPCGLALDGSHLYWANVGTGTIARANTDGTAVDEGFLATGSQNCGVAVDSSVARPSPFPGADTTPPRTKIVKGPGAGLASGRAKFRFHSSEAGSHFLCKLDSHRAAGCKSPKTYRHLKRGRHVFRVWSIDAAGNKDPTPAKRRFRAPA